MMKWKTEIRGVDYPEEEPEVMRQQYKATYSVSHPGCRNL